MVEDNNKRLPMIYKIDIDKIVKQVGRKFTIDEIHRNHEGALNDGEIIYVQENQLTSMIYKHFQGTEIDLSEMIINIHVDEDLKTKGEKMYQELAKHGFNCNGAHYIRFASGSGQIRNNTITFIRDDLYKDITDRLLCGLTFDDFGDDFNAAKFNAYFGLNMSGCHLLPVSFAPRVCIVDDMEMIRPHDEVNYVTEREVDYITLPEKDYILSADDPDFIIMNGKAIRKSDGVVFTIRHGIHKDIEVAHYDEIENSPCLNSFDGQGLMSPEWAMKVSEYLEFGYCASEMIIRAPWVKGLLATIDFHSWFAENGISEITDSFGKVRNVKDIDVIISKSQFKMHKVYKAKCAELGVNAWDYHVEQMKKNDLRWGVVKPDKPDDYEKALNYQYLEALDLQNDDVEKLCQRTMDFFKKLNSGDIKEVYKNLVGNANTYEDVDTTNDDGYEEKKKDKRPRFQKALDANPDFINDKYIRSLILQECENKLNSAKLGKIIIRGNYQFCVSDPIAQLQWIAKNHCGADMDVKGVIPSGCIYSNYWMNAEDNNGVVTLLRSPLIDRNEIAKRKVIDAPEKYFGYIHSGIIYSIHDLTLLQQAGADCDGDLTYSTNDLIIAKGSYDYGVARPLYYELGTTGIVGAINDENALQADIRGLNSKVGQISNKAASFYAMLEGYDRQSKEYKLIYDQIIVLGEIVGREIDKIKTGIKPTTPMEWKSFQVEWKKGNNVYDDDVMITSEPEAKGIFRHNDLVPDVKPYFLKFNYLYLDKDIRQLRYAFNRASVINFMLKLDELETLCNNGEATEEMQRLYNLYIKAYPVNDSDCIVNHIAHLFEKFHFDLQKQINHEGRNMLKEMISDNPTDNETLQAVCFAYDGYRHFLRMETKRNNTNHKDGKKEIRKSSADRLNAIRNHYRQVLMNICGNCRNAFDYLVFIAKENEKNVWDLLGDEIIKIVG